MVLRWFLAVRSIRIFCKKTWAIPIMNPLSWFMIIIQNWMVLVIHFWTNLNQIYNHPKLLVIHFWTNLNLIAYFRDYIRKLTISIQNWMKVSQSTKPSKSGWKLVHHFLPFLEPEHTSSGARQLVTRDVI